LTLECEKNMLNRLSVLVPLMRTYCLASLSLWRHMHCAARW